MSIFNNKTRPGYEELVSYGPRFYADVKEMDANYKFAGWTLDLMAWSLEYVVTEQFFWSCSSQMLSKLETFFNIPYDSALGDYERRNRVAAIYLGYGKMSAEKIIEIIKLYFDTVATVSFPESELIINFAAPINELLRLNEINRLLSRRIPAHLKYRIMPDFPIETRIYAGIAFQDSEIYEIRQVV